MLEDIVAGDPLSPTAFSMSVLNSSPALFSILRKDVAPATAIAAAAESFGYGLIEASLQLANNPHQPVLFIYADEPAPALYKCAADDSHAHAIALLLQSGASTTITSTYTTACAQTGPSSDTTQSRAFMQCLTSEQDSAAWQGAEKSWQWHRQAAS